MNETEQLLTKILDCSRTDLYVDRPELKKNEKDQYEHMLLRRASGEPLQYILGEIEYCGLSLRVNEHVLIPRQETEILIEKTVESLQSLGKKHLEVLELGTGSGCIAIALAKRLPDITVTAVDVSKFAINIAKENAQRNEVEDNINFIHEDMVYYLRKNVSEMNRFDCIVSNPPYISHHQLESLPGDVKCEPALALDGGVDGLYFIKTIIDYAYQLLNKDGCTLMEIGDGQEKLIKAYLNKFTQYKNASFIDDLAQTPRVLNLNLA